MNNHYGYLYQADEDTFTLFQMKSTNNHITGNVVNVEVQTNAKTQKREVHKEKTKLTGQLKGKDVHLTWNMHHKKEEMTLTFGTDTLLRNKQGNVYLPATKKQINGISAEIQKLVEKENGNK